MNISARSIAVNTILQILPSLRVSPPGEPAKLPQRIFKACFQPKLSKNLVPAGRIASLRTRPRSPRFPPLASIMHSNGLHPWFVLPESRGKNSLQTPLLAPGLAFASPSEGLPPSHPSGPSGERLASLWPADRPGCPGFRGFPSPAACFECRFQLLKPLLFGRRTLAVSHRLLLDGFSPPFV